MAMWRYVFADLLTDRTIDVHDLAGVTFERRITQAGTFKASLAIPSRNIADRARQIVPGRTVVHAYRDADIWGTFIIWIATPGSDGKHTTLELQGAALESYLFRRELRADAYTPPGGLDQLALARALIVDMQVRPQGNIGLVAPGVDLSGVVRDRTYLRSDAKRYGDLLVELANLLDGFEWMIRTYPSGGARVREFVTGYPTLGQALVDHVYAQPGNILSWKEPSDATAGATSFQARGDNVSTDIAEAEEPLMSQVFEATDLLAGGYPLLDATEDHSGVIEQATLDSYAAAASLDGRAPVVIPQATVRIDGTFSPNQLGDRVRLILVNDWYPLDGEGRPTYNRTRRVVGMAVTPVSRTGSEQMTLIFDGRAGA